MSLSEPAIDVHEALGRIPALSLLSEDLRKLLEASFEAVEFSLGDEIVREGADADAFYLLVDGSARVVKRVAAGDEVALNVLHSGDSFGEMALLEDSTRVATVRASGRVEALRLDRAVFAALTRSHPEVRTMFEALANERALWNFLRVQSSFSKLPNEAIALLCSELERIEVPAGEMIIREADPAGPMYVIESGRARSFRADRRARTTRLLPHRRLLRRALALPRRAARGHGRGGHRLRAAPLHARALPAAPGRVPRVPRAGASSGSSSTTTAGSPASRSTSPRRSFPPRPRSSRRSRRPRRTSRTTPPSSRTRSPTRATDSPSAGAGSAASRTSTSSTRWIAAPPHWRWSAGTSAVRSASRASARRCTPRPTGRAWRGSRGAPTSSASRPGRCARRRASSTGSRSRRSCTGRATTGSCSTRSTTATCASPTRREGCARSRATSSWRSGAATRRSSRPRRGSSRCPSRGRASPGCGRSSVRTAARSRSPSSCPASRPASPSCCRS